MTLMNKYPVQSLEIAKTQTTFTNVDEVIASIKAKIDAHPVATYIATFDHYSHTKSLANAEINPEIKAKLHTLMDDVEERFDKELSRLQANNEFDLDVHIDVLQEQLK